MWAPIPQWEQQQLQALSNAGMLSGVDPEVLSVIDSAESSGQGGGINSAGYGGWFGLSAAGSYPTGSTSPALLSSTSPAAFDTQASIAAGEFASLLERYNNDPVAAEQAYQTGSPYGMGEGASLMSEYIGGATSAPSLVSPSQAAMLTSNTSGTPATTTLGSVGPFQIQTQYGFIARALLVIVGIFLLYLGFKEFFSNKNATDIVVQGTGDAGKGTVTRIKSARHTPAQEPWHKKAEHAAEEGAAAE